MRYSAKIIASAMVASAVVSISCSGYAEENQNDPPNAGIIDFAKDVQPIFAAHCYACHGPDKQESNFRLDVRVKALGTADLGDPPIVAGNGSESPLIAYVSGSNEDDIVMPPADKGKPLSAEQIAVLSRWIDQGAKWPDDLAGDDSLTTDHWSFQPLTDIQPPAIENSWIKNGIDAFIFRKLNEKAIEPSSAADRVTFIRRIYLDMHGLPPTQQQVQEFVADRSEDAYRRVIDHVLNSAHYGERWARHWLDVVRFGESTGFEVNRDRANAYYYRDYVIGSLNDDKSYRDFIVEQIAGDALGIDAATGFLVGGPHDIVKSPDINLTLMQREDELADIVNTTGTAFLGLTVGCARCHNHKFDPILQKDYYSLQAVFAGVQHGERKLRDFASDELLATTRNRLREVEEKLRNSATAAAVDSDLLPAVNARVNVETFDAVPGKWVRFTIHETNRGEPCIDELEVYAVGDKDNVALASRGGIPTSSGNLPGYEIHKLEHINDGREGNSHSWISNSSGGWVQIELPKVFKIQRIVWGRDRQGKLDDRLATKYKIDVASNMGEWLTVASSDRRQPLADHNQVAEDAFIARLPKAAAAEARVLFERRQQLRSEQARLEKGAPTGYVGTFKEPKKTHRLYRGDPLAPREEVAPDALTVIGTLGLNSSTPEQQRRLALARWIADPKNPLTARVIVNRVWHYHFGSGIVSTPSDLGANGTAPTHPELLDWLAGQFMKNGWSLKWLHRQILSSSTYQQSSAPREAAMAKDAGASLLWRFPPRRLAAETIRDCVLHVSGVLNQTAGGPGFLLFEIDRENVHHYFPKKEFGPGEWRRMIYMTKIRQEQDEVFGIFDCPDGGQVIPNRSRSTTPLQALNLLNSHFMLQQIDLFAKRIHETAGADMEAQVRLAFQLVFSREPNDQEYQDAFALAKEYGLDALCRALLNANEFLFLT